MIVAFVYDTMTQNRSIAGRYVSTRRAPGGMYAIKHVRYYDDESHDE